MRVAVFARGNDALAAMEAGAVRVGAEEMADEISSKLKFYYNYLFSEHSVKSEYRTCTK